MRLVIVVFRFGSTSIASCCHRVGGWLVRAFFVAASGGPGGRWQKEDGSDSVAGTVQLPNSETHFGLRLEKRPKKHGCSGNPRRAQGSSPENEWVARRFFETKR
jgi:hypothetical protein